jgi:hypothetical protein
MTTDPDVKYAKHKAATPKQYPLGSLQLRLLEASVTADLKFWRKT